MTAQELKIKQLKEINSRLAAQIKAVMEPFQEIKGKFSLRFIRGAGSEALKFRIAIQDMDEFYNKYVHGKDKTI